MPASIIDSNTTTPRKQKIRGVVRNATEEDWLKVDPKIDSGEIVFTSDKNTLKVGDGQTKYSDITPIAGGGSGTTDYEDLSNKPSINNVTLSGDKTASDLGLATAAQGSLADTALQPGDNISDLVNNSGFITGINSSDVTNALGYTPVDPSDLSTVATTGDYDDLINKPALGTAAYTSSTDYDSAGSASAAETAAKNYADSLASNYATAAQGAKADTALQPGDLSNYVTTNTTQTISGEKTFSGKLNYCAGMTYILAGNGGTKLGYWSYDIDGQQNITLQTMTASTRNINFKTNNGGKVTYNGSEIAKKSDIPTNVSSFTNDSGYITGINSSDVTSALGYTPVDPSSLATIAYTADYTDLINTPTIPTVGDGTITLTQGGVTKGTFTTNQSGNTTIALDASGSSLPSQTGHDGEFLTTDGTDPSWGVATAVTFREWGGNE